MVFYYDYGRLVLVCLIEYPETLWLPSFCSNYSSYIADDILGSLPFHLCVSTYEEN